MNQPPTHFAIPVNGAQMIRKILGQLPHDQVSGAIAAMDQGQPITINPPAVLPEQPKDDEPAPSDETPPGDDD